MEVTQGVRWYIDKKTSVAQTTLPSQTSPAVPPQKYGLTAGVLELSDGRMEAPIRYDVKIWLRGQKAPLPEAYATIIGPGPGHWKTIRVSRPIDDVQSIERVEFTQQHFRFEQIKGVETHLDLLPPDP